MTRNNTLAREKGQILHEGRFVRLVREGRWEFAERTNCRDAVNIVAVTAEQEVLLVEQYRPAVAAPVLELPAGLVGDQDPEESPALAAERELLEETGYRPSAVYPLFSGPPSAGLASEQIHFFRGEGLTRVGAGGGDETEQITVHLAPFSGIRTWLDDREQDGMLVDPKIRAGLFALT